MEHASRALAAALYTCFTLIALALLAGCGDNSYSAEELQKGREALEAALETWKKGDKLDSLKGKAVEFTDPDWKSGAKLHDYKITRTEGTRGDNIRCWSQIHITTRQGKKLDREICYEVRTKDKVVIGRDPMN